MMSAERAKTFMLWAAAEEDRVRKEIYEIGQMMELCDMEGDEAYFMELVEQQKPYRERYGDEFVREILIKARMQTF